MCSYEKFRDAGVSPVVGVMLMLVVTIIIAAVVSGFSGSLMGGTSKAAPTLAMDIKIANTGTWVGSGFTATVVGTSEAIATKNLKIVTLWKVKDSSGQVIVGGNTSYGQPLMAAYTCTTASNNPPFGFGPGVGSPQSLTQPYNISQQFGNYSLIQGTGLAAMPAGVDTADVNAIDGMSGASAGTGYGVTSDTRYAYTGAAGDPATMVLGGGWEKLREGDVVTVNVIYVPTGKVILSKDISVTV